MAEKALLNVIFASDKRRSVLKLLRNGPQSVDYFLDVLKTNRPSLLPQMKILEDNHLIIRSDGVYGLTSIGKLIVDDMMPLVTSIDVLATNLNYWGTRDLDSLPSHLLSRLRELECCNIIEPPMSELYEVNREFHEMTKGSSYMNRVATFIYPNFFSLYSEYIENNVQISLVFSQEMIEKIRAEYKDEFNKLIQTGKMRIFQSNISLSFMSIAQTDNGIFLRLFKKNREFDSKQLMCCSPSAIEWGKDTFQFYQKHSSPILNFETIHR